MEQSTQAKRKQTVPTVLFLLFLSAEIVFGYLVDAVGDGDIGGVILKTIVITILIGAAYQRIQWAIWAAGIVLILLGVLCFPAGWEQEMIIFYCLGLFYILFGMYIINSRRKPTATPTIIAEETKSEALEATVPEEPLPQQPVHSQGFVAQEQQYVYPLLIKRYQAIFVDSIVLFAVLITIMMLTDGKEHGTTVMVTLGLFILFTYEPLLTVYGATVGQKFVGIRVRKMRNPTERISLFNAYIRVVTKFSLGYISFLTINTNPEHRAIHDFVSGSVMVREKKI
jgi:uncharacterized RDD family membrane protein YckC